ncbi:hypothetical protein FRC00_009045 [Tulasnella sp. 408]|nr:hypothetical protein FRC00_009045 [Tulasnella sp. 408]
MFGVCSRGLAKALENTPKGGRKDNPENDTEFLSPEFATALATGKPDVIKNFVDNQEKGRNAPAASQKSTTDRNPSQAPSAKKTRYLRRSNGSECLVLTSTASSHGNGKALPRNGEENTRRFFAELRSLRLQRGKPAITIPPIGQNIPLTLSPGPSNDNTQSSLQATPPPTLAHPVNSLPIPATINSAFPSTSTEVSALGSSLPPSSSTASGQARPAWPSEPNSYPEQQSQNLLLPATPNSREFEPTSNQHPFETSSITLKSESRDSTPEVGEARDANPNSSSVQSFLSNLQPPLAQYTPAFEKLGVKNSDDLLILKGLAPASIREFLQELCFHTSRLNNKFEHVLKTPKGKPQVAVTYMSQEKGLCLAFEIDKIDSRCVRLMIEMMRHILRLAEMKVWEN